jgi:hypothetical protein
MRAYLIRLTAAAILASLVRRLAPKSGVGRASRLGAGLLILVTAFGPVAELDPLAAAKTLLQSGYSDVLSTQAVDQAANSLLEELISDGAEAYILDKAGALGLTLSADVTCQVEDTYPVPWSVRLEGSVTAQEKQALSEIIRQDLGIPEERQEWVQM